MKRAFAFIIAIILLFSATASFASSVEVPKKSQGIVNDTLYKQYKRDMSKMFKSDDAPGLAVGMTAAQLETVVKGFTFNFNPCNEPIAYVCQAKNNKKLVFMALMTTSSDKNKQFLIVALNPFANYMAYESEFYSRKAAIEFMNEFKNSDNEYAEITYEQFKKLNLM